MWILILIAKTLAAQDSQTHAFPNKDRRPRSKNRRRRAKLHRFAAWLMDVQDSYSDTAR